ncbi:MAG: DUF1667 domain-containing protein [Eubacteriales bacterium]
MTKRRMTCTVCPVGCELTVSIEDTAVSSVEGNSCKRGVEYAKSEIVDPRRTLTSVVPVDGSDIEMLPVKSSAPIPKARLMEGMGIIKKLRATAPVSMGQVLAEDFILSGVKLVACRDAAERTAD